MLNTSSPTGPNVCLTAVCLKNFNIENSCLLWPKVREGDLRVSINIGIDKVELLTEGCPFHFG